MSKLYFEMKVPSTTRAEMAQRNASGISIAFRLEFSCGLGYLK